MSPLFQKLNLKLPKQLHILNAPASFESEIQGVALEYAVSAKISEGDKVEFALVFVTQQTEINDFVAQLGDLLEGDAILWMCYPKGSSKKYKCDFNRDTGWEILGKYDLEPVRMVAIDSDWSALRFRKVAYIKKITRKFDALSEAGKLKQNEE